MAIAEKELMIPDWWEIAKNKKVKLPRYAKTAIRKMHNFTCVYCGNYGWTVDHIKAQHRGGDNKWSNLTCACEGCNRMKGHISRDRFVKFLEAKDVSVLTPQQQVSMKRSYDDLLENGVTLYDVHHEIGELLSISDKEEKGDKDLAVPVANISKEISKLTKKYRNSLFKHERLISEFLTQFRSKNYKFETIGQIGSIYKGTKEDPKCERIAVVMLLCNILYHMSLNRATKSGERISSLMKKGWDSHLSHQTVEYLKWTRIQCWDALNKSKKLDLGEVR